MSGRVNERYWRLPTIVLYSDGSDNVVLECILSVGLVAEGVAIGFSLVMRARVSRSMIYRR